LEKTSHGQGNSILTMPSEFLLKVYQKVFANGKTTFKYLQKGIIFQMER